jgi:GLPGLI family protein
MKKIIVLILAIVSAVSSSLEAQITEGHISYKMDVASDDPDMAMAVSMMQGSKMEMYFKDKATRVEMSMGAMMNITSITDENSGNVLMLMGGMMGKNAVQTTIAETEKSNTENMPKYDVTFSDETKVIEGYNCKKAILTDEEGNENIFWYTEEIMMSKKGQNYLNEEIPGMAMQYDMNNGGLKMTLTVTKVETTLDKKTSKTLFQTAIPDGYNVMTMDQLKMMGGGQ